MQTPSRAGGTSQLKCPFPGRSPGAPPDPPSPGTDLCSLQVFFSRDQGRAKLVIDGLRAQDAAVATTGQFVARTPLYLGGVPAGRAKSHIPVRWSCDISLSLPVPSPVTLPHACWFLAPLRSLPWPLSAGCIDLQFRWLLEEPTAGWEAPGYPLTHIWGDAMLRGRTGERSLLCCGWRVHRPRYPQQPGLGHTALGLGGTRLMGVPLSPSSPAFLFQLIRWQLSRTWR